MNLISALGTIVTFLQTWCPRTFPKPGSIRSFMTAVDPEADDVGCCAEAAAAESPPSVSSSSSSCCCSCGESCCSCCSCSSKNRRDIVVPDLDLDREIRIIHHRPPTGDDDAELEQTRTRALAGSTGTVRGLFVGINYTGTQSQLEGCQNDADNMRSYWTRRCNLGEFLHLEDRPRAIQPTRQNILRALTYMVARCVDGDTFFFHYSGHGSYTRDASGDEADQRDECLVPLGYDRDGMISDDDLRAILVDGVATSKKRVRIICVVDACHSGTMMDLHESHDTRNGQVSTVESRPSFVDVDVTMISGCRDDQTSADVRPAGKPPCGALTDGLLRVLERSHGRITHRQLMIEVGRELRAFTQVPQLSNEVHLDLDRDIQWGF